MNNNSFNFKAGLIGSGIQASLTPAMHMQEARAQGYNYQYDLLDVEGMGTPEVFLPKLISDAERNNYCGLNITHPCKQLVISYLDELSDDAAALGAVNTVVLRAGKRIGFNTDWWGFAQSFKRSLGDVELSNVVQLGAGGAGAATAYAILKLGAEKLTIFDTEVDRALKLVQRMTPYFPNASITYGESIDTSMSTASGLIHATPTGMVNYPGLPLPAEALNGSQWVAEVVYFPLETQLVKLATDKGCRVMNGGGMAVFQAVGAFQHFTKIKADAERMVKHFQKMTNTEATQI